MLPLNILHMYKTLQSAPHICKVLPLNSSLQRFNLPTWSPTSRQCTTYLPLRSLPLNILPHRSRVSRSLLPHLKPSLVNLLPLPNLSLVNPLLLRLHLYLHLPHHTCTTPRQEHRIPPLIFLRLVHLLLHLLPRPCKFLPPHTCLPPQALDCQPLQATCLLSTSRPLQISLSPQFHRLLNHHLLCFLNRHPSVSHLFPTTIHAEPTASLSATSCCNPTKPIRRFANLPCPPTIAATAFTTLRSSCPSFHSSPRHKTASSSAIKSQLGK